MDSHSSSNQGSAAYSASSASEKPKRIIKRYSNRKLYDTRDSRYVTLLQIAQLMREGEEVQIIDNQSKSDLTEVTLAQIIYEEQKSNAKAPRAVPLQALKDLIHQRTEKVLSELREGPIGRLIPGSPKSEGTKSPATDLPTEAAAPKPPEPSAATETRPRLVEQAKGTLEDWQQRIDERVRAVLPNILPWQQLQHDVARLSARVEHLEEELRQSKTRVLEPQKPPGVGSLESSE